MAGALMRDGRDRSRGRRRRPHRRQRRHRQQDRHLHRRGARARARHPVLRRGAVVDDRSRDRRTARASRSKSATGAGGDARRLEPARPGRGDASATPRSTSRRTATSPAIITDRGIFHPPFTKTGARRTRARSTDRRAVESMMVLGIETSCDETAAAVVEAAADAAPPWRAAVERRGVAGGDPPRVGRRRPGDCVAAARARHLRRGRARARRRGRRLADLDAVAVTAGPGLIGSLLVGVSFAKSAAWAAGKPLVAVNHLAGHIESLWLEHGEMPTAGGGARRLRRPHEPVSRVRSLDDYRLIGRTRDDAAGEAYDKVAKLLGLGYPGGPIIDRLAGEADAPAIRLPSTRLTHPDRNAADARVPIRLQFQRPEDRGATPRARTASRARRHRPAARRRSPTWPPASSRPSSIRSWNARLPQRSGTTPAQSALPAAFRRIHSCAAPPASAANAPSLPVFVPSPHLSTDNAAMIAAAGLRKVAAGLYAPPDLNAHASLALG